MAHALPALPYAPGALAPIISEETISFHYGKHHQAYVTNLNGLLEGTGLEGLSLDELLASQDKWPEAKKAGIYNNAAQVWNHTFYWESLVPGGSKPSAELAAAIDAAFGSFEEFKKKFIAECVGNFGSGWTWLVKKADGTLAIEKTGNAVIASTGKPLLTCDVWEHAYYVDYRNARPKYAESLFDIYDWARASQRFAA
ncbi:MAG: superoxide dismutase [Fe] [Fibrobacteria bacterium]|nr:superoxide dismutase [Fe] [Fibrobacteria bacterium]